MKDAVQKLFKYQTKEEERRKSYILNIILLGTIILLLFAVFLNLITNDPNQSSVLENMPAVMLGIIIIIFTISKRISSKLASYTLILLVTIPSYYLAYGWGTTITNSWMGLVLSVVMGGILINSLFSFTLIFIHSLALLVLTYYQQAGIINYVGWDITPEFKTLFVKLILFFVIGIITWLSNREVEKALVRAKRSEKELKKERDLLEVKVEKRTEELEKEQMEKILHLYRFADYGRLAAGMFHDLITPLTMVSLNLEMIEKKSKNNGDSTDNISIKRAISGTKTMEGFVKTIRKQIGQQKSQTRYSTCEQVEKAIEGLRYRAKKAKVTIGFNPGKKCYTVGNPLRFYQVASNIISNAIDSYQGVRRRKNRQVLIHLDRDKKTIKLNVTDFGCGISKSGVESIFDSFYTTKSPDKNMGIGLSISRDIIEKELGGDIYINSQVGKGSTFTVDFPLKTKQS